MVRHHAAEPTSGPIVDELAVEEPLEMRVEGQSVAVTMRTPGHDLDLTTGFLLTEGVIDGFDDIRAMAHVDNPAAPKGNTVNTLLAAGVPAARARSADRTFYASSSCGLCGKATIDRVVATFDPLPPAPTLDLSMLYALPARLRARQDTFDRTGGLHAAGLFQHDGTLLLIREDIGRHNAVDKVIGAATRAELDLGSTLLVVSGRAGFEIVQKAVVARVPVLAAVGAPSSLAADLAHRAGMILVGFLRPDRLNLYGAVEPTAPETTPFPPQPE
ncbi:MAG: sulfurtransferase FdhD [Deltaproteobacteria bacterium]|nr:sulfurtransferase FdhD [Deltaproteobacteria bacterium]HCH63273.1 formate dehydrogenase accessory sulfurtransferase FdhD [Deltaproteobacteria bacterium]